MSDELRVTLERAQPMGGCQTPGFAAQLHLEGRYVAFIQSDGLGGPPVLEWLDPRGRDAELLARWRAWCSARAERIYKDALGVEFPASVDRDGVDWVAEELAVFELWHLHTTREAIERRRREGET